MTELSAPTGLALATVSTTAVDLSWTDTSGDGETGFQIEVLDDSVGVWEPLATVPADTISYAVTELDPMLGYSFRVRAVASVIESAWSNVVTR